MPIYYIDRKTGETKEEIVAGYKFLQWLYQTKSGAFFLEALIKKKLFTSLYGKFQDTKYSKNKIKGFIESLEIDLSEALIKDISKYSTFNDFFARKLTPDSRPIIPSPDIFISPADGRVFAWENIDINKLIQVKGLYYNMSELLQNENLALSYAGGTCFVIRLCPADYHRFHFSDRGVAEQARQIKGQYYSVNPMALAKIPMLYCENKRELTLFKSDNFGEILLIEVGATCVGSIIQTYSPGQKVAKGEEKGYFKFGGSTMIILLKNGSIKVDEDILINTANGIETKLLMGDRLGVSMDTKKGI